MIPPGYPHKRIKARRVHRQRFEKVVRPVAVDFIEPDKTVSLAMRTYCVAGGENAQRPEAIPADDFLLLDRDFGVKIGIGSNDFLRKC